MIRPARLNMTIYQGSTLFRRFVWKHKRDPIDITGYTFRMQIRPCIGSPIILADYTTETGEFSIDDPEEGSFFLEVSHEETETYDFDQGVYDIECVFPDGRVSRILYGTVILSKEVTR